MRAILINPVDRTIKEVTYNGDYREINNHVECSIFTIVRLGTDNDDVLFLDDCGLLTVPNPNGYFMIVGYPSPLAGKALVLATDRQGESVGTDLPLEYLKARVTFLKMTTHNGQKVLTLA